MIIFLSKMGCIRLTLSSSVRVGWRDSAKDPPYVLGQTEALTDGGWRSNISHFYWLIAELLTARKGQDPLPS